MTKRQIIDEILEMNSTACASFLSKFGEEDLTAYLTRLHLLVQPRLTGDVSRYEKYFNRHDVVSTAPSKAARWRAEEILPVAQPVAVEAEVAVEEIDSQSTLFPAHA